MQLVTLAEAKERLSIDFSTKDGEIIGLVNAIEGYLFNATGLNLKALKAELTKEEANEEVNESTLSMAYVAKEYVLLRVYLDYYNAHTEIDDLRLTSLIKQLQVSALTVEYSFNGSNGGSCDCITAEHTELTDNDW